MPQQQLRARMGLLIKLRFYKQQKQQLDHDFIKQSDELLGFIEQHNNNTIKYIQIYQYLNVFHFKQRNLKKITFEYSSDYCEAILDGLNKASELNWRQKTTKFLFLIADAPPHGRKKKFHNFSRLNYTNDSFPDGCPCGLKEDFILNKLNELGIKLVGLKLNNYLNLTIQVFQNLMKEMMVLNNPNEMKQESFIDEMEEIICEQLRNEEITIGTE